MQDQLRPLGSSRPGDRASDGESLAASGIAAGDIAIQESTSADALFFSWIKRCHELAESDLDGIETPARELVELAGNDRQMMEHARRMLLEALEHEPHNATLQQMYSLWRRTFEKGAWVWQGDSGGRTRYL